MDAPLPVGWATGREEFSVDLQTGERFYVTSAGWGAKGDIPLVSGSAQLFLNVQTEEKLVFAEPENNWFVRTYMMAMDGIFGMVKDNQSRIEFHTNQENADYYNEFGEWEPDPWNPESP